MFLISDAMAATAQAAPPSLGESLSGMLPMFLMVFALFYFMMIRPQNKKQKAQQALLAGLKIGDEVLTSSGLLGEIVKIKDDFLRLSTAAGTSLVIQRAAITAVLPQGTLKSMES